MKNNFETHFNTSYLTESYIIFTLKMESVSKKYNFWPKNDGEKWSRKNIFEIPPAMRETTFPYFTKVPKITNSVIKITIFLH